MDVKIDGDGFLVDRSDWNAEVMYFLADNDGISLTDEHIKYIVEARTMFEESGTVPAIRKFAKVFGMDRKATLLYELFESGPMKKIAKYAGLPKPTGCV